MNKPVFSRQKAAGCLASALLVAILVPAPQAHTRPTDVTWLKDIAPIVDARCGTCHSPAGARPNLMEYQEARAAAREIRAAVLEGRMPPWPAARGLGDFSNDRSLSLLEIELI